RECLGQRPVEGDVFLFVVAHGEGAVGVAVGGEVGEQPAVHRALVPGGVLVAPVVRQGRDPGGAGGDGGHVPGLEVAVGVGRVGLLEDRPAGGQLDGGPVGESAGPGAGAEGVVEAAVFLHRENQVLDLGQVELLGARGGCLGEAGGQHAGQPGGA